MIGKLFGRFCIFGGLLLLAAALCLALYNIREQTDAANSAAGALNQIKQSIIQPQAPETVPESTTDLWIPEHLRNPDMPMPETEIDGQKYIGIVTIPALEISLPVISEWTYPRLKVAPCRFVGSAYKNDLIIMAHNYATHFGGLGRLQQEDEVYFEDMSGNVFQYRVVEKEIVDGMDGEEMVSGEWDLTLFTCTVGGKSRVTIRCEQVQG